MDYVVVWQRVISVHGGVCRVLCAVHSETLHSTQHTPHSETVHSETVHSETLHSTQHTHHHGLI